MTLLLLLSACSDYKLGPQHPDTGGRSADSEDTAPPVDTSTHADTADTGATNETGDSAPAILLDPSVWDFGTVAVGTPLSVPLRVTNGGTADLHLATVASSWTLSEDLSGATLAPGASRTVTASALAVEGVHADVVSFDSDDPAHPTATAVLSYLTSEGDARCSWDAWVPDDACGGWLGTGVDGDVSLTTWEPVSTDLTADLAGTVLSVTDETGFAVDDEVLVYDPDTGAWALTRVLALAPMTVQDSLTFVAGASVQRVPHYRSVSVPSHLTGDRIVFRACGTVTLDDDIDASGGGWLGGRQTTSLAEPGWQGRSEAGRGGQSQDPNGTGGGGAAWVDVYHADGGGGGHATPGATGGDCGWPPCKAGGGTGGGTVGTPDLATIHPGGGGGSGSLDVDAGRGSYGGEGGRGGGIVRIAADAFTGTGRIRADGQRGQDGRWTGGASPGGGGGGAGGTVWLLGEVGVEVSAVGGTGGEGSEAGGDLSYGGTGGDGAIRIDGTTTADVTPAPYATCGE